MPLLVYSKNLASRQISGCFSWCVILWAKCKEFIPESKVCCVVWRGGAGRSADHVLSTIPASFLFTDQSRRGPPRPLWSPANIMTQLWSFLNCSVVMPERTLHMLSTFRVLNLRIKKKQKNPHLFLLIPAPQTKITFFLHQNFFKMEVIDVINYAHASQWGTVKAWMTTAKKTSPTMI